MKKYPLLLTAFFILGFVFSAQAQFRKNQFGKNRVQYKRMEWRYISTPNFDIYFYDGGYDLAKLAAEFAEEDFDRITDLVGFSPYNKTKILIYNSIVDLQQSNIGVYYQSFAVGGQTNFVRSEVEIAFTGTKAQFKRELALGIADVLIFEMMYGGSLKEIFQSSYLLNLPDWFMSGAASYIAHGWDVQMDDFMRDLYGRKKFKKIDNLEGFEARMVGQSVWNYIAEEYGKSNIANVLNLTRLVRNEEQSIQQTLGISFKTFIKGWKAYYEKQYKELQEGHELPTEAEEFLKTQKDLIFNQIRVSPNGKLLAYSQVNRGRYKVRIVDLTSEKKKAKTAIKGGYKLINQKVDTEMPLLAWRDNNELGIFAPTDGDLYFYFYELNEKGWRKDKRQFKSFSNVKDLDISSDGNYLVMSAEWRGKNDIYYYDYRQRKLTQLTNDPFDDRSPRFLVGDERKIVFSSNRPTDSLVTVKEITSKEVSERFNIFVYDLNKPDLLNRLTNTLSSDYAPMSIAKDEIVYLSDQRGIAQLYHYNLRDSVSTQVTNFLTSIKTYHIWNERLFFSMYQKGSDRLYLKAPFDARESRFTNKTFRQQVLDVRTLQALKKQRQEEERRRRLEEEKQRKREQEEKLRQELLAALQQEMDSLNQVQALPFDLQNIPDSVLSQLPDSVLSQLPDSLINRAAPDTAKTVDTDNYQFDTFSKGKRKSFLERYRARINEAAEDTLPEQSIRITRSREYERMFAADNFVTSLVIDPLRSSLGIGGWGLLFEVAMTDVLENHKINAGIFYVTDLRNSNLFAEYEYLRTRLDYRARFERRNLEVGGEGFTQRYAMNIFQGSVSYPFNITSRLTLEPFFVTTRYTNLDQRALFTPDELINYSGFNAEFIYDNSIVTGTNMMQGTRFKARYENYIGLGRLGQNKGFGQLTFDFRNYQKLHRSLIFATRLSYGQFMGKAKKNYLLGGADNWLFNKTDREGEDNPLNLGLGNNSDLFFLQYAMPLRGFNYNKLYGNNFILFNAELRFPLLKYFYKGTITSNFFRNLQLVGFTDVGASWTGISPFNRENALNTENINNTTTDGFGFRARVQNFKNPFLVGYGVGARTMLLGYYTKFDVAWGMEDNVISDPKFYLTLGYDF